MWLTSWPHVKPMGKFFLNSHHALKIDHLFESVISNNLFAISNFGFELWSDFGLNRYEPKWTQKSKILVEFMNFNKLFLLSYYVYLVPYRDSISLTASTCMLHTVCITYFVYHFEFFIFLGIKLEINQCCIHSSFFIWPKIITVIGAIHNI